MQSFYTNFFVWGNSMFLREYVGSKRVQRKFDLTPTLYIPASDAFAPHAEFQSIDGVKLQPMEFETIKEASNYIRECKSQNSPVFGNNRWAYSAINDIYEGVEGVEFDPSVIRTVTIDIETTCENGFPEPDKAAETIILITVGFNGTFYTFGLGSFSAEEITSEQVAPYKDRIKYIQCQDEYTLLSKFLKLMQVIDPDVITGWNVEGFDIPYLVNRMKRILGEKMADKLSPWGIVTPYEFNGKFGEKFTSYELKGVEVIDYLQAYKKFTYTQQGGYSLDNILFVELGKRKVNYSEYGPMHTVYKRNFQLFTEYNIYDVAGVQELDDKMRFIDLITTTAYRAKVNYSDVFTQVAMWDALGCNYLKNVKKVIPDAYRASVNKGEVEGAYVKTPVPGFYRWIISFDLNSLYPHLIMQYNISPETIQAIHTFFALSPDKVVEGALSKSPVYMEMLEQAQRENFTFTANGAIFTKNKKGFLPEIMESFYNERKVQKKKMLQADSMVQKIDKLIAERKAA